ncbi:GlsB/YeaQ/YmgE family stress response membrane protein, partial [Serratia ureilytica]|nr:GlsB/YeaQ/YmgE family stress response membrane protein [Serratia ureilytica]
MGGVSLLLYGVIGASGIRVLIESKVDYNKAQNLILTVVLGIIGAVVGGYISTFFGYGKVDGFNFGSFVVA